MSSDHNISSLLKLADDPDESVWLSVRDKLLRLGYENIERLNEHWKTCDNSISAERIEGLISEIKSEQLTQEFSHWINSEDPAIKQGIILICRLLDPDFNNEELKRLVKPIERSIWLELSTKLTALEKVRIINHLLFEKQQITFKQNIDARSIHFFLPTLLKTRIGHPLTISLLFILLARELELPVFKVSSGDLAALVYLDAPEHLKIKFRNLSELNPLFYILLDHQIEIFGKSQFLQYLQHQYPTQNQNHNIVPDHKIIEIILLKLKYQYEEENNPTKVNLIGSLLACCHKPLKT